MSKIRSLLITICLAGAFAVPAVTPTVSHGCTGDLCDGICDTFRQLNDTLDQTPAGKYIHFTTCG